MGKRKTDRLSINYKRIELVNKIVDKWIERMIKSIQYNQDTPRADK